MINSVPIVVHGLSSKWTIVPSGAWINNVGSTLFKSTLKDVVFACDQNDENAYFMVAEKEGKGASYLVFSPDDRIKEAAVKFIPKFIANSAFK